MQVYSNLKLIYSTGCSGKIVIFLQEFFINLPPLPRQHLWTANGRLENDQSKKVTVLSHGDMLAAVGAVNPQFLNTLAI